MDFKERVKIVRAMETIARCINDEELFYNHWATHGVADGDIDENTDDEELDWYTDDERFSELMGTFVRLISSCKGKGGGLYCDGIVSDDAEDVLDLTEENTLSR